MSTPTLSHATPAPSRRDGRGRAFARGLTSRVVLDVARVPAAAEAVRVFGAPCSRATSATVQSSTGSGALFSRVDVLGQRHPGCTPRLPALDGHGCHGLGGHVLVGVTGSSTKAAVAGARSAR